MSLEQRDFSVGTIETSWSSRIRNEKVHTTMGIWETPGWEAVLMERKRETQWTPGWIWAHKCAFISNKTNLAPLWYSRGSMIRRMKKIVIPLCSALVRLHLEHCAQFGDPPTKKNVEKLEKATRMVCSLEDLNKNRDWESWHSSILHGGT